MIREDFSRPICLTSVAVFQAKRYNLFMKKMTSLAGFCACIFFNTVLPLSAEMNLLDTQSFGLTFSPYLRTDGVVLKNTVDLDSNNKDDSSVYLGIDYGLGFNLKLKDIDSEAFLLLERNGPFDYDAPLFIHNTLITSTASVERYRGKELLPHVEEFWYDLPVVILSSRFKAGLFVYKEGHEIASPSDYENFSLSLYKDKENLRWKFYYCRPDLVNKSFLGPRIRQEREQGIHYTPNAADFFAANAVVTLKHTVWQPYAQVLFDRSGKRNNLFSSSTRQDVLGTIGLAWDLTLDKFSFGIEAARNVGRAKSDDPNFKDVEHCGYLIYTDASYEMDRLVPHFRSAVASGNKVTTDMAGDTTYTSGKNRGFSVYSPLNTHLSNSIYPKPEFMPLVSMGGGSGLNYGVARPNTFSDPYLFENLLLFCLGADYRITEKFSASLDWWYLRSMERGVGTLGGSAFLLSPDLGHEWDLGLNYQLSKNISLDLLAGYFLPGHFYKEERDDTSGSLFTPFLRGDGEADAAYQIELSLTFAY